MRLIQLCSSGPSPAHDPPGSQPCSHHPSAISPPELPLGSAETARPVPGAGGKGTRPRECGRESSRLPGVGRSWGIAGKEPSSEKRAWPLPGCERGASRAPLPGSRQTLGGKSCEMREEEPG